MANVEPTASAAAAHPARRAPKLDLEGAICDLRNATIVLETMAGNAIGTRGGWCEKHIKKAVPGMEDYHIFVLTEDQASGLDYILHHVGNLARSLHSLYFGEDEEGGPVDDGNGDGEEGAAS